MSERAICAEPNFDGPCSDCKRVGPRCVCWVVAALCGDCCRAMNEKVQREGDK